MRDRRRSREERWQQKDAPRQAHVVTEFATFVNQHPPDVSVPSLPPPRNRYDGPNDIKHAEPRPLGGGQVIDITTGSNETRAAAEAAERIAGIAVSPPGDGTLPEQPSTRGATDRRGNGRTPSASAGDEILQGLEGMSPRELLKSFRRAQEERVALYGKFNRCPVVCLVPRAEGLMAR